MKEYYYNGNFYYLLPDICEETSAYCALSETVIKDIIGEANYLVLKDKELKSFKRINKYKEYSNNVIIVTKTGKDILTCIPKLDTLTYILRKYYKITTICSEDYITLS